MKSIFTLGVIGSITILFFTYSFDLQVRPAVIEYQEVLAAEEPKTILIELHPATLNDIADCESGVRNPDGSAVEGSRRHYLDDQSVVINVNKDGTQDIGVLQINTYHHGKRAKDLGYDLWKESDNWAYGRLLYREQGTAPWNASKSCWK